MELVRYPGSGEENPPEIYVDNAPNPRRSDNIRGRFLLRNAVIIAACLLGVTSLVFGSGLLLLLIGDFDETAVTTVVIALLVLHGLASLGVLALFIWLWKIPLGELGIRRPTQRLWHILWQAPLILMVLIFAQWLLFGVFHLGGFTDPTEVTAASQDISVITPLIALLSLLGIGVLAPLWEELFFRGLLLEAIRRRWGIWAGVILSSLIFGLAHLQPLFLVYLTLFGAASALLRLFHKNLWGGLIMHMFINLSVTSTVLAASI